MDKRRKIQYSNTTRSHRVRKPGLCSHWDGSTESKLEALTTLSPPVYRLTRARDEHRPSPLETAIISGRVQIFHKTLEELKCSLLYINLKPIHSISFSNFARRTCILLLELTSGCKANDSKHTCFSKPLELNLPS